MNILPGELITGRIIWLSVWTEAIQEPDTVSSILRKMPVFIGTKKPARRNLLLFFHRLPYTYRLSSGKTLIQHVYDIHFEGYEDVEKMEQEWISLEGKIPQKIYERVKERFEPPEKEQQRMAGCDQQLFLPQVP